MTPRTLLQVALLSTAIAFSGCAAFELRDANEQWTSSYSAKKQAEKDKNWPVRESAMAALSDLAADAAQQARKERTNALNRIAFYRVATLAAWQAEESQVLAYADAGQKLCDGENFKRAPRDCGMFRVIPILAGVDETTRGYDRLQAKVTADGWEQNPEDAAQAGEIYAQYVHALDLLLSRRPDLQASGAPPTFMQGVDNNIGTLLCDHLDEKAIGLMYHTDAAAGSPSLECRAHRLKEKVFDAGLDSSSADCLPKSRKKLDATRPRDCP